MIAWAIILLLCGSVQAKSKPASHYFDICRVNQPDTTKCIVRTLNRMRPSLITGIPELKIIPIDPLLVPKLELDEGEGKFRLKQTLTNVRIRGLGGYNIKDLSFDFDKLQFNATSHYSRVSMDSNYEMNGKILVLPIFGKGNASYILNDLVATNHLESETYQKGNKLYLRVKSYKLHIVPRGGVEFHFSNLFNGDKKLGDVTNRFLNENWRETFETYRDLPEKAFTAFLVNTCNQFFALYSVDELFPK